MTPGPGMEPWTHWWEASALTTVPTLHPNLSLKLSVKLVSGTLPRTLHVTIMMHNAIVETTVIGQMTLQNHYTLQNSTFTSEAVIFPKQ